MLYLQWNTYSLSASEYRYSVWDYEIQNLYEILELNSIDICETIMYGRLNMAKLEKVALGNVVNLVLK